jgi:hypothetical protein
MQMPKEGTAWDTLVNDYGVFHLSRMMAEPKTKEIAGAFQARQEALEAYKKDYADILSIFEGDKRVTDSFFKQPPRGKKGKQPPETKA